MKATVIWVRLPTAPGAGERRTKVGAVDGTTDTLTTPEVAVAPKLSMATARSA